MKLEQIAPLQSLLSFGFFSYGRWHQELIEKKNLIMIKKNASSMPII